MASTGMLEALDLYIKVYKKAYILPYTYDMKKDELRLAGPWWRMILLRFLSFHIIFHTLLSLIPLVIELTSSYREKTELEVVQTFVSIYFTFVPPTAIVTSLSISFTPEIQLTNLNPLKHFKKDVMGKERQD